MITCPATATGPLALPTRNVPTAGTVASVNDATVAPAGPVMVAMSGLMRVALVVAEVLMLLVVTALAVRLGFTTGAVRLKSSRPKSLPLLSRFRSRSRITSWVPAAGFTATVFSCQLPPSLGLLNTGPTSTPLADTCRRALLTGNVLSSQNENWYVRLAVRPVTVCSHTVMAVVAAFTIM